MTDFVHLHVHSHYSLLDGLDAPESLVRAAKELGQTAIALTDHGVLSGHRALQEACLQEGVKPLLGVEAYISPTTRFDKRKATQREVANDQVYNHICLIAKNQTGLNNINKMSKLAWEEGFYYKPRIDRELLFENSEGVIVLSGCFNGIPAKAIEAGREDQELFKVGYKFLGELKEAFGDDAYVEVQPHNDTDINLNLLKWADDLGLKSVATADCHYAYEKDRALEDAFLVLSTNPNVAQGQDYNSTKGMELLEKLNVLYPDRFMTFKDIDVFVSDRARVKDGMMKHGVDRDDIYDNTMDVVDKVGDFDYPKNLSLLPAEFDDPAAVLESMALEGMKERGYTEQKYFDRLAEEMRVIRSKNFASYFLIVSDAINWARSQGIRIGPGRGSAAGSLVCNAIGITAVDPLKYGLLFGRFINEERNDFPDIDVDVQDNRRGEIKEYLAQKYGYVASIATYTYFRNKGVLKDAAKVLGVPYVEVESVMKEIPSEDGLNYYSQYHSPDEDDKIMKFKRNYPEVETLARQLVGRIRGSGMHAGGIVVSKEPIENFVPIETKEDSSDLVSGRVPVVAYDMNQIAEIGLIKMDFLGLSNLTVIDDTLKMIKENHGIDVDIDNIPLEDPEIYEELSNGNTVGIFQCDTTAYTSLLREMKASNFHELFASTALVRPGAMNTVGRLFIKRMHGEEPVEYVHDTVKTFLEETYGTVVYQEQVMQAAVELGGMSWSKADKLRKIIGKKRDASEFDQYRDEFIKGATRYISEAQASQLWHDFEAHAGYSFNKSHSVSYSLITMQTAWLKKMYPLEYMTALLKNEKSPDNITRYLIECRRLGIKTLLPHINHSDTSYKTENGKIRLGLSSVKYISDKVARKIIAERPYESYKHFIEVANKKGSGINKRAIEHLNMIGGAEFEDNLAKGNEEENYYEVLKIPTFDDIDLPDKIAKHITPLENYDETGGVYILGAQIKKVNHKKSKRTGNSYTQIDLMDNTSTASVFHSGEELPKEGQFYYILVTGSNAVEYMPMKKMKIALNHSLYEHPIVKYLFLSPQTMLVDGRGVYVVKWAERKTKRGEKMGNLIVADKNKNLHDFIVFPGVYRKYSRELKDGRRIRCKTKKTDDGSDALMIIYKD